MSARISRRTLLAGLAAMPALTLVGCELGGGVFRSFLRGRAGPIRNWAGKTPCCWLPARQFSWRSGFRRTPIR
jgi:hypothetical protein